MSIHRFPGNFRLGVLNEPRNGVLEPGPSAVEPKLMVLILLSGWQRFRLAGHVFELDARHLPEGLVARVEKPCTVEYLHNWGNPLAKLALAVPLDWMDGLAGAAAPQLDDMGEGLSARRYLPDGETLATARAVLECDSQLRRMALGMGLLDQCLAGLAVNSARPFASIPVQSAESVVARLRRLIATAPLGMELTAPLLAKACGMGLRSLERLVRETEGTSLGALIREARLEAGLRSLHAGAPVARAAAQAGYSTAANFAAAVRRRYGASPGELRRGFARDALGS